MACPPGGIFYTKYNNCSYFKSNLDTSKPCHHFSTNRWAQKTPPQLCGLIYGKLWSSCVPSANKDVLPNHPMLCSLNVPVVFTPHNGTQTINNQFAGGPLLLRVICEGLLGFTVQDDKLPGTGRFFCFFLFVRRLTYMAWTFDFWDYLSMRSCLTPEELPGWHLQSFLYFWKVWK